MKRRVVRRPAPAASAWAHAAAQVVDHLDDKDVLRHLVVALGNLVTFEAAIFLVNRRNNPPLHIFDTMKSARAKQGVINYIRSTYLLNPFYNAFLRGISGGVYRIGEVAPDAYFRSEHFKHLKFRVNALEEIGYLTKDWPPGRAEVVVAMELPNGEMAELSLIQPMHRGGFSEDDLFVLGNVAPFLAAVFKRYWRAARPSFLKEANAAPAKPPRRLGGRALSDREREVAYLILKGHSTPSISLHLDISVTTVKTHRKNLYAKLGIATHYELFAMFLESTDNSSIGTLGPLASSSFGRMGSTQVAG